MGWGHRKSKLVFCRLVGMIALLAAAAFVYAGVQSQPHRFPKRKPPQEVVYFESLPDLSELLTCKLQGPLVDPRPLQEATPLPEKAKPKPVVQLPSTIQLVGIFRDADDALAVFEVTGHQNVVCRAGDTVEGAKVQQIRLHSVVLVYRGKEFELLLDKS